MPNTIRPRLIIFAISAIQPEIRGPIKPSNQLSAQKIPETFYTKETKATKRIFSLLPLLALVKIPDGHEIRPTTRNGNFARSRRSHISRFSPPTFIPSILLLSFETGIASNQSKSHQIAPGDECGGIKRTPPEIMPP